MNIIEDLTEKDDELVKIFDEIIEPKLPIELRTHMAKETTVEVDKHRMLHFMIDKISDEDNQSEIKDYKVGLVYERE